MIHEAVKFRKLSDTSNTSNRGRIDAQVTDRRDRQGSVDVGQRGDSPGLVLPLVDYGMNPLTPISSQGMGQ